MSQHCAICTSTRGPFTPQPLGRNNALVPVCAACDEPAFEKRGPERGYEPSGGLPTHRQVKAGVEKAYGDRMRKDSEEARRSISVNCEPKPAGWIAVNVPRFDERGRSRDNKAAYASLQSEPWGPTAKFIGMTPRYFVFARPPHVDLGSDGTDALDSIEQFRSKR